MGYNVEADLNLYFENEEERYKFIVKYGPTLKDLGYEYCNGAPSLFLWYSKSCKLSYRTITVGDEEFAEENTFIMAMMKDTADKSVAEFIGEEGDHWKYVRTKTAVNYFEKTEWTLTASSEIKEEEKK